MTHVWRSSRLVAAAIAAGSVVSGAWESAAAPPITLPGSSDAGRVDIDRRQSIPEAPPESVPLPAAPESATPIPDGASGVWLSLNQIEVQGVTAFPHKEIEGLYRQYLGTRVSLDMVWRIADLITARYQNAGFFLSRAFVPRQTIEDGKLVIRVVEGYVGEVEFNDALAGNRIVRELTDEILAEKPLSSRTLESILLRLNDLPGVALRAVVKAIGDSRKNDGAVKLVLVRMDKPAKASVSFDNYNSRYLGPGEAVASYDTSLLPMQETTASVLQSAPFEHLRYFNVSQTVALTGEISAQLYGGHTRAHPGYSLGPEDVWSDSGNIGVSLKDQIIRQRLENLSASLALDAKNTGTDTLDTPITRDRVRAVRLGAAYDRSDPWGGYDYASLTVSHGLPIMDANFAGESLLSRAAATPDFTKIEYNFTRLQPLPENVTGVTAISGQKASGPLYASEQFGYGGQSFGRAYDPSEILGDNGIAASLELRYGGLAPIGTVALSPYSFYDIGQVQSDGELPKSGASAGAGLRVDGGSVGLSANLAVAKPLTLPLQDPVAGNGKSLRYLIQLSYSY